MGRTAGAGLVPPEQGWAGKRPTRGAGADPQQGRPSHSRVPPRPQGEHTGTTRAFPGNRAGQVVLQLVRLTQATEQPWLKARQLRHLENKPIMPRLSEQ